MNVVSPCHCSKCGGDDLMIVGDPETGQPRKAFNHCMALCRKCGERTAISEAEAAVFLAMQPAHSVLQDDHPCPKCEYNMRGHRVGDACPECGTILTDARIAPASSYRKPTTKWEWIAIAFVILMVSSILFTSSLSKTVRIGLILLAVASGIMAYGFKGLLTRQITFYFRSGSADFEGLTAKTVGVVLILVGLSLLAMALFVLLYY